jgi:hypothetical protein
MLYRSTQPLAKKDAYVPSDLVQFKILMDQGVEIVKNSFSLSGDLRVKVPSGAGTKNVTTEDVRYDGKIGVHSFIEDIDCNVNGVTVEQFHYYPRYVRMMTDITTDPADLYSSESVCELRVPNDWQSQKMLRGLGREAGNNNNAINEDSPFWLRPNFALNKSNRNIRQSDLQVITVSFTLAQVNEALFGKDVGPQTTYSLKNLRLNYNTLPMDSGGDPLVFKTILVGNQTIQSNNASLQFQIRGMASAVSMSFQQQSHESNAGFNNTETEIVPQIDHVQFSFNDTPTSVITHEVDNLLEMTANYIESLVDTGHTAVKPNNYYRNKCFGLGLNWAAITDLANQKFSVQIDSDVSNNAPYNVYAYFQSMISI